MLDSIELANSFGISKTVYAAYYPETRKIVDIFIDDFPHEMYEEAWTKKQDEYHKPFMDRFKTWASSIVLFPDFCFSYPTNGSSEAIRESLASYAANGGKTIHIFDGEYEGYEALAAGYNLIIVKHNRNEWRTERLHFEDGDKFYISQPSAIDGNVWKEYDEWITMLLNNHPLVDIMLDLCYVGCVSSDYTINASYTNIAVIFFSLSKSFGVYYHRIGGVYSRDEIPGLWGNIWFKNLASLCIGDTLMREYGPFDIPVKYTAHQCVVIDILNQKLKIIDTEVFPSDVVLLGYSKCNNNDLPNAMRRGEISRWCLTPGIMALI